MKNIALLASGLIFSFMAIVHIVRYVKGWEIVVAHHTIPMQVSIYGVVITSLIAIWMFVAASK